MSDRHAALPRVLEILLAGLGAGATVACLLLLRDLSHVALLIPSFGATCALVFGVPSSPFARPLSVVGGHLVSSIVGLLTTALFGHGLPVMAFAVALAIVAMMATNTMHPPAGGNPLIIMATGAGISFLLAPILIGAIGVSLAGFAYRSILRIPRGETGKRQSSELRGGGRNHQGKQS